jgi:hypothetical protein
MHKCLAVCTGGSGHGHTQAVLGVRQKVVHNWAVFYVSAQDVSRDEFCLATLLGTLNISLFKTIDSFHIGSRIARNVYPVCSASYPS